MKSKSLRPYWNWKTCNSTWQNILQVTYFVTIVPGFSYQRTFQWASENFHLNTFYATGFFLYSLKTLENLWFSGDTEKDQWYELPESMRKLCLSTNFQHQEIRWNYGIFAVFELVFVWWKLITLRRFELIKEKTKAIKTKSIS